MKFEILNIVSNSYTAVCQQPVT